MMTLKFNEIQFLVCNFYDASFLKIKFIEVQFYVQ